MHGKWRMLGSGGRSRQRPQAWDARGAAHLSVLRSSGTRARHSAEAMPAAACSASTVSTEPSGATRDACPTGSPTTSTPAAPAPGTRWARVRRRPTCGHGDALPSSRTVQPPGTSAGCASGLWLYSTAPYLRNPLCSGQNQHAVQLHCMLLDAAEACAGTMHHVHRHALVRRAAENSVSTTQKEEPLGPHWCPCRGTAGSRAAACRPARPASPASRQADPRRAARQARCSG